MKNLLLILIKIVCSIVFAGILFYILPKCIYILYDKNIISHNIIQLIIFISVLVGSPIGCILGICFIDMLFNKEINKTAVIYGGMIGMLAFPILSICVISLKIGKNIDVFGNLPSIILLEFLLTIFCLFVYESTVYRDSINKMKKK